MESLISFVNKPPHLEEIREWLYDKNPLWIFDSHIKVEITDIDPKPWSGHFNFLVSVPRQQFVLRFKGPEWGILEGVSKEYTILKNVDEYAVGPKAYFLTHDFFGEPMMLMEYLEGDLFTLQHGPSKEIGTLFHDIASFFARIAAIPFKGKPFPFEEPMTSFAKNKKAWRARTKDISAFSQTASFGKEIETLLPIFEKKLDMQEPLLQESIQQNGSLFIFESAHAGHLLTVSHGFRFLNWEQVSYGDPSFMLAVFLYSIRSHEMWEGVKKEMSATYMSALGRQGVVAFSRFDELLEARLWERRVSNAIYSLWRISVQAKKDSDFSVDLMRTEEVLGILRDLAKDM